MYETLSDFRVASVHRCAMLRSMTNETMAPRKLVHSCFESELWHDAACSYSGDFEYLDENVDRLSGWRGEIDSLAFRALDEPVTAVSEAAATAVYDFTKMVLKLLESIAWWEQEAGLPCELLADAAKVAEMLNISISGVHQMVHDGESWVELDICQDTNPRQCPQH
jgi:hypothetical protein